MYVQNAVAHMAWPLSPTRVTRDPGVTDYMGSPVTGWSRNLTQRNGIYET